MEAQICAALMLAPLLLPIGIFPYRRYSAYRDKKREEAEIKSAIDQKDWKVLFDKDRKSWSKVSYSDVELDEVSAAVDATERLKVYEPFIMKHKVYYGFSHKSTSFNGLQMEANLVKCEFDLYQYQDNAPLYRVFVEVHYDEPRWDGQDMHYNYRILRGSFFIEKGGLAEFVQGLLRQYCCIDVSDMPRVRSGEMSYWTLKKYGCYL